jgi:hypothetical protein
MWRYSLAMVACGLAALAPRMDAARAQVPPAAPFVLFDLVWVTPAAHGTQPPCSRLLMLELPEHWMTGDAAAVLLTGSAADEAAASPVATALLAEQAGVLHYPSGPAESCANRDADPVAEVLGALRTLRREAGAGVVVAIGFGEPAAAATDAVQEDIAARHLRAGEPRLAAGAARDATGRWSFRAGATPPPPEEHWPARAPLLCLALTGTSGSPEAAACRAALVGAPGGTAAALPARR